jgi:hypothetical protein
MRKTLFLVATLSLGCAGDALVPFRVPATASVAFSNAAGDTSAAALGDSVVARVTFTYGCSGDVRASAGREAGTLVVTITDSLQYPVPCASLAQYRNYRAAVGPLRSGSYPVELRFRDVVGSSVAESSVLRTTVVIP